MTGVMIAAALALAAGYFVNAWASNRQARAAKELAIEVALARVSATERDVRAAAQHDRVMERIGHLSARLGDL